MRQIALAHPQNKLEKEFIKLFHSSNLPLHFNKKGNKQFTNYQRISLIILFRRSRKSLRDFIDELYESKWISWLGLKKIPRKSTLHDWLKIFKMKTITQLFSHLKPKSSSLTAIDGTGFDSFHRSRHYEKRAGFTQMPYAKVDLFVDCATKKIIDFSLVNKHQHDIVAARQFVKRNNLENIKILCDGAYDCESLHRFVVDKGGRLYAPVRKRNKRSNKKFPKGWFRKQCLTLPDFMGKRSIVEAINSVLKKKYLLSLKSKKDFMKKREFAWTMIVYNLDLVIKENDKNKQASLSFFILALVFH